MRTGLRRLIDAGDGRTDPVLLGRVLLAATGVIVAVTVPLLDADGDAWLQLAGVVLVIGLAIAASYLVPWTRIGRRSTLGFPLLVGAVLVALASGDTVTFAPLTGLLTLAFAFIGLTQPSRTSLAAVPFAAAVLIYVNGQWSAPVATRAGLACVVWALLGELLSHFTAQHQALLAALRAAAHTDALTGIANRRDLDLRLAAAMPGDAIVICDLDNFKRLNDTLGHHVGDRILAEFGSVLRSTLRRVDYCARFGGEEFVLILPGTPLREAEAALARLRANWAVLQPGVTFSAGISVLSSDGRYGVAMSAADQALYAAKASGRNCTRSAVPAS